MSTTAPLSDHVLAGRYRLGARRSAGADVAIFDAVDLTAERAVVVKVIHPELVADAGLRQRLVAVLGTAADLRHPHLSAIYDWGEDEWHERPVLFVVVELLRGGSLRELLDRGRVLTPSQTLAAGLDACRGLDALHRHGLVHGDVRPGNLMFDDAGRVRVADVGLSSVLAARMWSDPASLPVDRARYASPEQAVGAETDERTDVYSLCLSLIEASTGQVPFVGDSTVATLANRVDRLLPVSADLGPLAAVLERGGRPHAADRSTAAELGRALMQAAENLPRPTPLPLLGPGLFDAAPGGRPPAEVPNGVDPTATETPTDAGASSSDLAPAGSAVGAAGSATSTQDAAEVIAPARVAPDSTVAGRTATAGADDVVPPVAPAGRPRRGIGRRAIAAAAVVVVLAAGGVLAWSLGRTPSHDVPVLAGLDQGEALNSIAGFDWQVEVIPEASESVAAGRVVRTVPSVGGSLDEGRQLQMFVSTGPAPRVLPELSGMTADAATASLQELGLVARVGDEPADEVVPAGTVISWSVPAQPGLVAGATVVVGTEVVIVVSAGPAPRSVADVVGLGLVEATAALTGQQLVVTQVPDEFSDTVPAGQVARQDPAAGTEVPRGTTVLVAVSKGRDLVAVPDLGPLDPAGIEASLAAAGLRVGTVTGDRSQPLAAATIAGGAPLAAGQLVPRASAIDLTYPAPPP